MNRQLKRVIAFVLVSVMSLSLLAGCGKEKKQVVNDVDTTEYITRGEWISRLSDMFGMDDYEQSEAYYADVKPDSDIFAAVQSCRERNMLSTDTENFKPDDIATVGFVATTAVLASGVDYSKYADGTENDREAIIKCAKETNICSDISLDENVLRQGVDDIYATTVLDAAQGLFLAYSGEEKNIVEYAEGVINGYEDKSINVDDAGNLTMDSEVKVGDVIICPPNDEYPNGNAVKVTDVTYDENGKPVYKTVQAEIQEVYDNIDIATVVEAKPEYFQPEDGVTVVNNTEAMDAIGDFDYSPIETDTSAAAVPLISGSFKEGDSIQLNIDLKDGNIAPIFKDTTTATKEIFGKNVELKEKFEQKFTKEEFKKTEKWLEELAKLNDAKSSDLKNDYESGKITEEELKKKAEELKNKYGVKRMKYLDGGPSYKGGWKLTGTMKLDVSVAAAADIKLRWFKTPKINSYSVDITKTVESSLTFEGDFKGELKLGKFAIPIGKLGATLNVYVFAEIDGNGKVSIKTQFANEQKIKYEDGKTTKTNKHSTNRDVNVDVTVIGSVGVAAEIKLLCFDIVDVRLSFAIKLEVKAKAGRELMFEKETADDGSRTLRCEDSLVLRNEESIKAPIIKLTVGTSESLVGKLGLSLTVNIISEDDIKKGEKGVYKHHESEIKFLIDSWVVELDDDKKEETTTDSETTSADEEETTTIDEKDAGVLLLSQYAVDIKVGDQYKIEAKDVPKEYDKKPIIWESEDTSVATISSKGVIDAKKAGKTTIYGRTEDGKYIGKCIVLVRD